MMILHVIELCASCIPHAHAVAPGVGLLGGAAGAGAAAAGAGGAGAAGAGAAGTGGAGAAGGAGGAPAAPAPPPPANLPQPVPAQPPANGPQPLPIDPGTSKGPANGPQPLPIDPGTSKGPANGPQPLPIDPGTSKGPASGPQPLPIDPGTSKGPANGPQPIPIAPGTGEPPAAGSPAPSVPPAGGTPPDAPPANNPAPNPLDYTPGQGPEGITVTKVGGQPVITLPGGQQVVATPVALPDGTKPGIGATNSWTAVLPSGDILTINPNGSTSVQLINSGATQNWDSSGHFTGTSAPDVNGAGLANPTLQQDTYVPMSGGGYRIDHPDGSCDIHWPNGAVVHVEPDGVHWQQVSGPSA